MRKRFFRPFMSFHDPFFFPTWSLPLRVRVRRPAYQDLPQEQARSDDPHEIFHEFFRENGMKDKEREFFEKHYPEKIEKQFDPYQVLGLKKDATLDQVKEAYREQAIKYHPKTNSSPEAEQKFKDLAQAYDMITNKNIHEELATVSAKSLFDDFEKEIDKFFTGNQAKNISENAKSGQEELEGDLYSESSYIEQKDGKNKKVVVQKEYKKDGKLLKVKREQKYRDDGSKQVTQTFDDGTDVKKKTFVENKEQKKISN